MLQEGAYSLAEQKWTPGNKPHSLINTTISLWWNEEGKTVYIQY
jgi:hypothetical protein